MTYFHCSFYYVRYHILIKCWRQVLFGERFTFKLFFFSFLFTLVFFLHQLLNIFFRAIDELIFFRYRKTKINQPVFIIANPRSGTTFLHKLISNDERFAYMKLVHTIFPSVCFAKLYSAIGFIDRRIGNPIVKTLNRLDSFLYKGWDGIHSLGFNKTEEDEGLFTLALESPAVFILFPFLHTMKESWLLDAQHEKVKRNMMNYYCNCLQRFMFANGDGKIYLSKNVLSSGRINCLLEKFPDAKIIYLARHPYETLPSFISMFGGMYHLHSTYIKEKDAAMQAWAWLGIALYKQMNEARKRITGENLCVINYKDLIAQPVKTVLFIYGKFNWPLSTQLINKLELEESANKNYRSSHNYSLEQYGLSKEEIVKELQFVFDEFGFEQ